MPGQLALFGARYGTGGRAEYGCIQSFFVEVTMNEELITLVSEKTGMSAEQAKTSVETVINFIKERLPGPLGEHLENFVNSEQAAGIGG